MQEMDNALAQSSEDIDTHYWTIRYNDMVTMVGKGNGSYLVLLDLSAAFDTIDHDTICYIGEICWNNW